MKQQRTPPAHDAYAALRLPAFRRYFIGNVVLILGMQMQKVAVGWEIYERTGSALHLGYVGLAQFLPQAALALIAGHITDVYNRKHVLMASLMLNAAAAAGLAWTSAQESSLYFLYGFLVAIGAARAFILPARAAFLPGIVPLKIFNNAVSWNSSGFEISSMAGPAIGGVLIAVFGSAVPVYIVNASALALFIVLLLGIAYRRQPVERRAMNAESLLAGFRFIWNTKVVLAALTLDMVGVLLGGAVAMMPIYAKDILDAGPQGLGWLMAAPSVGAFTMALLQAHHGQLQRPGVTLLWAVTGFGLVTVLFGVSTVFWFSMAMLFFLGACDNISVVLRTTLVQILTPDAMRGRVSAINGLFIGTSNELGAFRSGVMAGFFGPVFSVVAGGVGTLAVVAIVAWRWPELRRHKPL